MKRGLILFGHGARDPSWRTPLDELAAASAQRDPSCAVEVAFLEIQHPSLPVALDALVARGVLDVTIAPIFWARGGHVDHDVPALLAEAQARHAQLKLRMLPVLSALPGMLDFIADEVARPW